MNINNASLDPNTLQEAFTHLGGVEALPAGLPNPQALEKLANAFFREGEISSFEETAQLSNTLPADAAGLVGEAPLIGAKGQPTAIPKPSVALPGIPGGVSTDSFSLLPTFSFLEEARSLFAVPPVAAPLPSPGLPTVKIPTTTAVTDLVNALPGITPPQIVATAKELNEPQLANATTPTVALNRAAALGFLDARPLEAINTIPTLEPWIPAGALAPLPQIPSPLFDVSALRRDFPILQEQVHGRPLIWLDNAATTQKPWAVIERLSQFYQHENSNIHRAAHELAARSTDAYEAAREKTRRFLNASSSNEIIFVRGATEGINLVAQSWGRQNIHKDDEIVITWLEHHANIVPWQLLCSEKGARLRVVPVDSDGQVILEEYEKLLGPKTKLVSLTQVSNALGTVTPAREMVEIAHRHGARVLVDGAQAVSHMPVDVQVLDCDFYVFSGHKVFAPTGIGVVYGKSDVLEKIPPWQGGGNMIADVTFEKTIYQGLPYRFEAGTGNIADAVGLGAAIDYISRIGMSNIARYEHDLLVYATQALKTIPGLHLVGNAREKAGVLSFVLDGQRTEDIGNFLNKEGIAVRSGHHCAQPILRRFGLESTVRPSLAFYNTCGEIDALIAALWKLK